jgi:hypothetical protein
VNKVHHKYQTTFVGYLYILDKNKVCATDTSFIFQKKPLHSFTWKFKFTRRLSLPRF